jgi:hypothetical protein
VKFIRNKRAHTNLMAQQLLLQVIVQGNKEMLQKTNEID